MFSLGLSIPMSPAVRTARFICYAGAACRQAGTGDDSFASRLNRCQWEGKGLSEDAAADVEFVGWRQVHFPGLR
jgi:hypothetical protein